MWYNKTSAALLFLVKSRSMKNKYFYLQNVKTLDSSISIGYIKLKTF